MVNLINREEELKIINNAITALTSDDQLVETPIVNFFGFSGIGKSRLLDEIVLLCEQKQIKWIRMQASDDLPIFSTRVFEHIQHTFSDARPPQSINDSVDIIRSFLEDYANLVLIIDTIDSNDEQQKGFLEIFLNELINYNNTFTILSSLREISFPQQRQITRKLSFHPLELLSKEKSKEYLRALSPSLTEEQLERIFSWTQGHPLAMNELMRAREEEGCDLDAESTYPDLIQRIFDALITKKLPAGVESERDWFQIMLRLFAVPRRFNLILMRQLIESFEAEQRLTNNVEYIKLPRKISRATGVLQWNRERGGFTLEEPVRTLLILQLKMQFAERYHEINRFLADLNWQYASETENVEDCVQYEKEYAYHRLVDAEPVDKATVAAEVRQKLLSIAEKDYSQVIRFQQDLLLDDELQEALGSEFPPFLQQLYQDIAGYFYRVYQEAADPEQRGNAFDSLFSYLARIDDPAIRHAMTQDYLHRLSNERDADWVRERYERLEASFLVPDAEEY